VSRENVLGKTLNGEVITEVIPDPDIYGGGSVRTESGRWHSIRNESDVE
jgi:hypothetical protein